MESGSGGPEDVERFLPSLAPFERFYREAEARNFALVTTLLAKMENPGSDPNSIRGLTPHPAPLQPRIAVLVAGGFHTPGLQTLLRDRRIAYVSFVPKITHVDDTSGTKYLSVFAQEKTPLDKLFAGEKLFLAKDPAPLTALHQAAWLTAFRELWRKTSTQRSRSTNGSARSTRGS